MTRVELRTGVWYNDRPVTLTFPDAWDIVTHWPDTPPPWSDDAVITAINSPIGQPPLRELARGKKRPVFVVDDLSRPTPVYRVIPFLLRELQAAGVSPSEACVLLATGTHGRQDEKALERKLGRDTIESCRVVTHNDKRGTKLIGKTSYGTPVYVNRHVLGSDLIVGIGGVYPQHTTGFGGGSKLALGVLGRRSIAHLHFRHDGVGGTYDVENDFRRDLAEIARMIGLTTIFTMHVNSKQELVNLICGNHFDYYDQAADFSRFRYDAPPPEDADVVVANAYPSDVSVFFMRKAMAPIDHAPPGATSVMVASNHAGLGHHGLFYPTHSPRINAYRRRLARLAITERPVLVRAVVRRLLGGRAQSVRDAEEVPEPSPRSKPRHLWVYSPPGGFAPNGSEAGTTTTGSWDDLLGVMKRDHPQREKIRVRIYPCSSLQCVTDRRRSAR